MDDERLNYVMALLHVTVDQAHLARALLRVDQEANARLVLERLVAGTQEALRAAVGGRGPWGRPAGPSGVLDLSDDVGL